MDCALGTQSPWAPVSVETDGGQRSRLLPAMSLPIESSA